MAKLNLWIVQYLCPARHALCAAPYDRDKQTPEEMEAKLLEAFTELGCNPWCGLCGSRELRFDHGKLAFGDWDTALRALRVLEQNNAVTRAILTARRADPRNT